MRLRPEPLLLLLALLACGSPATLRNERVGASLPLDGPRAVGPVAKRGESSLQVGATVARVKTVERSVADDAPANVVSRRMLHAGYFGGVSEGLEVGGALMLARTEDGSPMSRNVETGSLKDATFGGLALSFRGVMVEDGPLFLLGTSEVGFLSLPYYERVSEAKQGSDFAVVRAGDSSTEYLQFRAGLSGGVHALQSLSLAGGFLLQNYPLFQSAVPLGACAPNCEADTEDPTSDAVAFTSYVWLSYAFGRFSVSGLAFVNTSTDEDLGSALPFGGTVVLGYRMGHAKHPGIVRDAPF